MQLDLFSSILWKTNTANFLITLLGVTKFTMMSVYTESFRKKPNIYSYLSMHHKGKPRKKTSKQERRKLNLSACLTVFNSEKSLKDTYTT